MQYSTEAMSVQEKIYYLVLFTAGLNSDQVRAERFLYSDTLWIYYIYQSESESESFIHPRGNCLHHYCSCTRQRRHHTSTQTGTIQYNVQIN